MKNNYLFKNRHFQKALLIGTFLFTSVLTFAQSKEYTFTGTVTEGKTKFTLPGASVSLDGKQMANADFDGSYKFKAKLTDGVHVISSSVIGFKTKKITLTIGASDVVVTNFGMYEDILSLDEIVITGAAVNTNKKQLGNAIATVKSSEIRNSGATSVDQALTGKVSGALISQNSGSPAGGISITLRGVGTITGNSDPLYIVDGVYINNNTNNSVNLGGNNQNRLVDINPNDIDRIEVVKGAAGAAIYGARGSNGVVQIFTKKGKNGKTKFNFTSRLNVNELRKKIPYNEVPFTNNSTPTNKIAATRYDFQDIIFGIAYGNEQNLNVSGGNENTNFYISGSSLTNGGIIKNSDFQRFGIKTNVEHKVNSSITLNSNLEYIRSTSNDVPSGLNGGDSTGAIDGFLFGNNTISPFPNALGVYPSTSNFSSNPLEVINNFKFKQVTNRFIVGFGVKAKLTKRLSANYNLGIDSYNESGTGFLPLGNTVKTGGLGTGFARRSDVNFFQFNNDLNLTYVFDINKSIKSTTVIGGTWQNDKTQRVTITATGLGSGVSSATSGAFVSQVERRIENAFWGSFLQQSFSFDDKFFLNGAVRQDASSLYAKQNRNQLFYKGSTAYLISNESFWNDTFKDKFNSLKLRAAWGEAGNLTALPTYNDLTTYSPGNINGQNTLVSSTRQGNADLKPETKVEIEFGVDASFFNNRLSVEYTYYKQKVKDLLLERSLSPSTGFSTKFENVGNLQNEGMELLVKVIPYKSKDLNWNVTLNYGRNRNSVSNIPGGLIILPTSISRSAVIEGQPTGVFYSTYYARDAAGNILLNSGGLPFTQKIGNSSTNDLKIIGDPNPDWLGSLINEVQYKNFAFRFQLDAVQGFDVLNYERRLLSNPTFGGGVNVGQEILGVIPTGTGAAQAAIFEEFVEDGSFVKLREVSLTYNFKPKSLGIDNIQISLTGRNLYSWDNFKGFDPEVSATAQTNGVRGVIAGAIPIPKTYQFGVNVSF